MIMNGIRKLNEPISFLELKVYNDIDTSMCVSKTKGLNEIQINIKFEEVIDYLENYLAILEPNIFEYKA